MKAAGISEIAVQVGDAHTWCYGDLWTWTNPGASHTVTCSLCQIGCPAAKSWTHPDPSRLGLRQRRLRGLDRQPQSRVIRGYDVGRPAGGAPAFTFVGLDLILDAPDRFLAQGRPTGRRPALSAIRSGCCTRLRRRPARRCC
jgi:hypothetical protein